MRTGISKSLHSRYWRQRYRAALFEIEESELPARIAESREGGRAGAGIVSGRRR